MITLFIISSFCSDLRGIDNMSCNKFLEASTLQLQWKQPIDTFESYMKSRAENLAKRALNEKILFIGGVTYKVYTDKKIEYTIRNFKKYHTSIPEITPIYNITNHGYSFKAGWEWRF